MEKKHLKLVKSETNFMGSNYPDFLEILKLEHNLKSIRKVEKEINRLREKRQTLLDDYAKDYNSLELGNALCYNSDAINFIKTYLWQFYADCLVKNFPFKLQLSGVRVEVVSLFDGSKVYPTNDATICYNQNESNYLSTRFLQVEEHCNNILKAA